MKKLRYVLATLLCTFALAAPVAAVGAPVTVTHERAAEASQSSDETATTTQETKLSENKRKVCEKHQTVITNIMKRMSARGQRQLDLFTSIAEKTEKFYTAKGKTVSNYDQLTADVSAKKAAAQSAVDALSATSTSFTCSQDNPKGVATSFKAELKTEISALKAYKTSVKNLIVAVKSAQGTTTSGENQ